MDCDVIKWIHITYLMCGPSLYLTSYAQSLIHQHYSFAIVNDWTACICCLPLFISDWTDFPTYWSWHFLHSIKYMSLLSLQVMSCEIENVSPVALQVNLILFSECLQLVQLEHLLQPLVASLLGLVFVLYILGSYSLALNRNSLMFRCRLYPTTIPSLKTSFKFGSKVRVL